MTRLSVVSQGDDRELDAIRRTIRVHETVASLEELLAILRAYATRGFRVEILDTIGHSRTHGFLVLGTWEIDDSQQTVATFIELLRPLLNELGVRTIRLLGCSTATSQRGRAAIRRIAQVTGCQVLGTDRYISKFDYDASGFVSHSTLVDADGQRMHIAPPTD